MQDAPARGEVRQAPKGSFMGTSDDYEQRSGQEDEYELEDGPLKVGCAPAAEERWQYA